MYEVTFQPARGNMQALGRFHHLAPALTAGDPSQGTLNLETSLDGLWTKLQLERRPLRSGSPPEWRLRLYQNRAFLGVGIGDSREQSLVALIIKIGLEPLAARDLLVPIAKAWNVGLPYQEIHQLQQESEALAQRTEDLLERVQVCAHPAVQPA